MISSDSKVNPVKKAKKKLLLLVLLLAFCLSCSLSIAAEIDRSNDVKTINITFQELVTRASKYNILFNDWRDTPDKGTYHIVPGKLNSQKTFA